VSLGCAPVFRQIRIVKIEIPDAAAIGECGQVRRRLVTKGAKDRGSCFARNLPLLFAQITNGSSFHAPSAQARESITRRFTSCTTSFERFLKTAVRTRNQQVMSKRCLHIKNRDFQSAMILRSKGSTGACRALALGKQTGRPISAAGFFGATASAIDFSIRPRSLLSRGPPSCSFQTRRA